MITVNIITNGAELKIEQPTIADGTAGGMVAKFCTDSLWSGLALTAVFRTDAGDILMPLNNNECEIPFEATSKCGEVLVGLFGTDGYRTLTSVFTKMNIAPGAPTEGDEAENYTPSLYEQFSARFAKVENMTATAEAGDKAAVVRSDNGDAMNFHFVLPRGDRGERGEKGAKGEKGDVGAQGPKGERGEKGDTGAQGPKGERGEKGEKGDVGLPGKDGVDGKDGEDGKDAINNVYYVRCDGAGVVTLEGISNQELIDKINNNEPCTVYCIYEEGSMIYQFLLVCAEKEILQNRVSFYGFYRRFESDILIAEVTVDPDEVYFAVNYTLWDYPCLIEGTPINMADGSVKAVEEVKSGDIVQSYNPVTKELTPAVVVKSYVTGHSRDFTVYNFSNGSHLTIYGLHGFYNQKSGATKDIRKITRNDRLIDLSGDSIQWVDSREMLFSGEKRARYNIITSNNLYFANGVLLGSRAPNKLQFALDRHMNLPEEIRSVWQKDCDDYDAYNSFLDSPEFYKEVGQDYQELAKAKNIIKVNKKRLADSDYKVQKYTEGLIDEAEWQESKGKRSLWRKEINNSEEALKHHQAKVDGAIDKHRMGLTPRKVFESCCERDNAIFDICKEFFAKRGVM